MTLGPKNRPSLLTGPEHPARRAYVPPRGASWGPCGLNTQRDALIYFHVALLALLISTAMRSAAWGPWNTQRDALIYLHVINVGLR